MLFFQLTPSLLKFFLARTLEMAYAVQSNFDLETIPLFSCFEFPHVQISMPDRQMTILELEDGLFPLTRVGLPTKPSLYPYTFSSRIP